MSQDLVRLLEHTHQDSVILARFLAPDRYVVVGHWLNEGKLTLSVSAGRQVDEDLTAAAQQVLYDEGFRRQRASEDYRLELSREGETTSSLSKRIQTVFEQSFGLSVPQVDYVELARFKPDNEAVKEAITHLAKARDWSARKTLYRQLIDASFSVPYGDAEEFLTVDHMGSWRVVSVYLDEQALMKAYPLGQSYRQILGRELFPKLCAERIGALRINPKSAPRGELYRNELEMINQGISKLAKHYGWS